MQVYDLTKDIDELEEYQGKWGNYSVTTGGIWPGNYIHDTEEKAKLSNDVWEKDTEQLAKAAGGAENVSMTYNGKHVYWFSEYKFNLIMPVKG